jgi:hypothetical protein
VPTGIVIERQNIPYGSNSGTGYKGKEARGKGAREDNGKKHSQK